MSVIRANNSIVSPAEICPPCIQFNIGSQKNLPILVGGSLRFLSTGIRLQRLTKSLLASIPPTMPIPLGDRMRSLEKTTLNRGLYMASTSVLGWFHYTTGSDLIHPVGAKIYISIKKLKPFVCATFRDSDRLEFHGFKIPVIKFLKLDACQPDGCVLR